MISEQSNSQESVMTNDKVFRRHLASRQLRGKIWSRLFLASIIVGLLALALLFYNVIRQTYTLVVIDNPINPSSLANRPARELSTGDLLEILEDNLNQAELQGILIRQLDSSLNWDEIKASTLQEIAQDAKYPEALADIPVENLTSQQTIEVLEANLSRTAIIFLVADEVFHPAEQPLRELSVTELTAVLGKNASLSRLKTVILQDIAQTKADQMASAASNPLAGILDDGQYPEALGNLSVNELDHAQALQVLETGLSKNTLLRLTVEETIKTDYKLEDLSEVELAAILSRYISSDRMRVLILEKIVGAASDEWQALNNKPISELLDDRQYPQELRDLKFSQLNSEQAANIFDKNFNQAELIELITNEIVQPKVVDSWTLNQALTKRSEIEKIAKEKYPTGKLEYHSWLNLEFLKIPMHSRPELSGLRTAVLGSLWMMVITVTFAFPIGIGAAIYLEEYATDNFINRIIQVNITNLAGVPSIIYGILGLAVFVRFLEPITSGAAFGVTDAITASGRTVLSAGLTMALLILPIVIINAQEAIRAVPPSLREASYGMGATKLQMIWTTILPNAMPGIMTGTILAISRAFGETAPLVVVGSITRITVDPSGPFSRFTAIPIQIYTWTSQPQDEFRSIAAAAIIVLLAILLIFNSTAIVLRNRFSKRW